MTNEKNCNPLTVRNYKSYLMKFLEITKIENVSDINTDSVKKLKSELISKGVSPKTINYYLIGLRMFLKYLVRNDIPSMSPEKIDLFSKTPDKIIDLIGPEELKLLLTYKLNPLSDILVNMLFTTGLRISELNSLNIENLNQCQFSVLGKGGKVRVVFVSESVCAMLNEFIATQGRTTGPLFVNKSGKRISVVYLQSVLRTRCDKLSISKKVTPHTLRHLFATDLLANGAPLRSIQELLGHSSITMTQRYTHITNQQLKDTFNKFHSVLK